MPRMVSFSTTSWQSGSEDIYTFGTDVRRRWGSMKLGLGLCSHVALSV